MGLLCRHSGAVGISGGPPRESDSEPDQMKGRGHKMESPGVSTLTHWLLVLPKALVGCLDQSYTYSLILCALSLSRAGDSRGVGVDESWG